MRRDLHLAFRTQQRVINTGCRATLRRLAKVYVPSAGESFLRTELGKLINLLGFLLKTATRNQSDSSEMSPLSPSSSSYSSGMITYN